MDIITDSNIIIPSLIISSIILITLICKNNIAISNSEFLDLPPLIPLVDVNGVDEIGFIALYTFSSIIYGSPESTEAFSHIHPHNT